MSFNFKKFLKKSRKIVTSKSELIDKINDEIQKTENISGGKHFIKKQLYLKRLNNAIFAAKMGQFKEPDEYNNDLSSFLDMIE